MTKFKIGLVLVVILSISYVQSKAVTSKQTDNVFGDNELITIVNTDDDLQNWWKNSVFYQIYPRSFKDSDGNGVGDLQGIIEKLDHLKDAGIGAAWLSPVFKSPMKDFGYDVEDFYLVDPIFGDNDDLMELLQKAHDLGIKLILDFVPNHTSDQHDWFKRSIQSEDKFNDYYVWHDGIDNPNSVRPDPPNNWLSVFSGSAWTWNEVRQQYYLHQFTPEQPDLNFRNTDVQEEMFNVIKHWIEIGFDGFRIDAINHMFETPDLTQNELPATVPVTDDSNNYEYLEHTFTRDLDETYDIVRTWRQWIDDYNAEHPEQSAKVLLTEVYTSFDLTMRWYGTVDEPISHIPFNFDFIMEITPETSVEQIKMVVDRKIAAIPEFGLPNWVMGNHDRNRVASRYSPAQVDAINIIALTLPGIAVTYYGEEIGMEDNQDITWDETVDPRACQTNDPENYQALSRDPVRTPFQWDSTEFAGFSTDPFNQQPWLPVHPDYKNNNLKAQKDATESHFKVYQRLTALRQKMEFRIGNYQSVAANNVFSYKRSLDDTNGYIVAVNFKDVPSSFEFSEFSLPSGADGKIVVSSSGSLKSIDSIISTESVLLEPYEAIVFYYSVKPADQDWWKKSIFYQIYPRSFKDSNGDGIGDLRGIIEKLGHLQDAGVGAVWLSPIFKSPMVDMGYDIQDYKTVDPIFGTNEDLLDLLEKAHELGLKLILDLVPNHTSDQHEWFKKSAEQDDFYKDFYIWDAGRPNENDPTLPPEPPNNWLSVFSGSAWTWHDERKEFYLHQFFKEQPDLNFRNKNVKLAMFDILKHYVEKGFDGFRIDAINYLFEDQDLTSELIRKPPITSDETAHDYLDHQYTKDLDENYGIVAEWRQWIDEYNAKHPGQTPKILLTEAYSEFDENLKWYGDKDAPISQIPFNFDLITDVDVKTGVATIKEIIDKRINAIPSFGVPNWVLGNHDNSRVASRYSTAHIDALNMLVLTLPGIAVTYYGEEIGMEDYNDFELNNNRDPERTPFQWDSTLSAGFSTNKNTWLPVHPDFVTNNLENQIAATASHYKIYQLLSKLRQKDEFVFGNYESVAENDVLLYKRFTVSYTGFAVAINFGSTNRIVPFRTLNRQSQSTGILEAVSLGSSKTLKAEINPFNLELAPYEAIVFSYIVTPTTSPPSETPDPDWWKKTVFYQIYPRSFKDSNGDGTGDLQGIINNLNHFNDAGIGAVWLSPVFASPMKDFGYDIKDFYEVDPIFGTTADLIRLLEESRKLGIKVILDFVPNHTSDEHEWFKKSVKRDGIYTDYYIWHDGINNGTHILPPNNWLSVFSGPAWSWNEERGQFYLRQFTPEQPDLNFRNTKVQDEIFNVLKYWIEVGFDGFRIDAINHMFEVADLLLNEPELSEPITTNPQDYEFLEHKYTRDLAETYEIVQKWRQWVDEYSAAHPEYPTKVLLTEVYTDFAKTMDWYGTAEQPISHIPFNFDLIMEVNVNTPVATIKQVLDRKIKETPWFGLPNWVLGNHDRNRVASRFRPEQVDGLNMLAMTLPGIAVTYYGEEIGMQDNQDISWEDTQDPRACQTNDPENYRALSRDPVRTPFQWDSTANAGFSSTTNKTWLPVPQNLDINLKAQKEATVSHYKLYQKLTALRQETEFLNGNYESVAENDIFAYKREILSNQGYGVAINFGNGKNTIQFKNIQLPLNPIAEIVAVSKNSLQAVGSTFNPESIELAPYEAIIFHFKTTVPTISEPNELSDPDWWKKTVFYQIYPRSFKDSDADGVGDLQGIIDNLDHFIDAGIGAVWLSPVFTSPMKDFGYDIKDFYEVDPLFGTTADLILLLEEAHKLGIKVILDFVPNHTSNEHVWFVKSVNREGIFTDFYIWQDGIRVEGKDQPDPPNNWLSVFSGSAWTWNDRRQQYYLHQFTPEQPDLNFRNPMVLEEMFNVIKYWIEMGFDGFRVDAINHMYEVSDYSLNEPPANPSVTTDTNDYEYLEHKYTRDLDETYEVVRKWRAWMDEYSEAHPKLPTKILLTEVYADLDLTMRWYGSEEEPISHVPFNFDFIMDITAETTVENLKAIIDNKIEKVPEFGVPNWVMGNHDRNRVASRFTPQQVDTFNILAMTLPGVAVTYYGEEIGMEDNQDISWEDTQDPRACQTNDPENYRALSRDPVRTPFQWSDAMHAGFSSQPSDPWLPVHENYINNNLVAQKDAPKSHYKIYQALTALRQDPEFWAGDYKSRTISRTFNYIRRISGGKTYGIAINFDSQAVTIDFTSLLENGAFSNPIGTIHISSINSGKSKDSQHGLDSLGLGGYEAIVFEVGSGSPAFGAKITISFALVIAVILRNFI